MICRHISTATILSIGLVGLTVALVLGAHLLGFFPDSAQATLKGRKGLCEAIAVHCSLAAAQGDVRTMEEALRVLVLRNPDVLSVAVRAPDGDLLVEAGDHRAHWQALPGDRPHRLRRKCRSCGATSDGEPWKCGSGRWTAGTSGVLSASPWSTLPFFSAYQAS